MDITEFKETAQAYLLHLQVERNFSKNTTSSYEIDYQQFIDFWQELNAKQEKSIKDALDRFFLHLFHKKIASSSIARKVSSFKSLEQFLEKKGTKLSLNLVRPRLEKKLPIYLSMDEIFRLLDTASYDLPSKCPLRDKAILELLYATGIRCSELVSIRIQDINLQSKTVLIRGKGNKERLVLFNDKTAESLLNYMNVERGVVLDYKEHLFVNFNNEQLSSRTIQRVVKMFRKFLNVEKKITPHKIRHTFATHLLNQGVDIRTLQELLGHQSLSSTEKYTHVTTTHLTEICREYHPINSMKRSNESTRTDPENDK